MYSRMFEVRRAADSCFSNLLVFHALCSDLWYVTFIVHQTDTHPSIFHFCSRYRRKKHANFSHYTPEQEEKMLTMLNEVNAALAKGNKKDLLSVEEYKFRS